MTKNEQVRKEPLKIAVLGSGSGSNCQAIFDAINQKRLNARVVCVISDVEDAFILQRARKAGVPSLFISASPFKTKLDGQAEQDYINTIKKHGADVIALAGFMRILKKGLLEAFPRAILNIHPSLLPSFPGLHSWKQAISYGVKVAGCTVHLVDSGTDSGPIILQRTVQVLPGDTPETLHARIQVEEHIAYPEALQMFAEGAIS